MDGLVDLTGAWLHLTLTHVTGACCCLTLTLTLVNLTTVWFYLTLNMSRILLELAGFLLAPQRHCPNSNIHPHLTPHANVSLAVIA